MSIVHEQIKTRYKLERKLKQIPNQNKCFIMTTALNNRFENMTKICHFESVRCWLNCLPNCKSEF